MIDRQAAGATDGSAAQRSSAASPRRDPTSAGTSPADGLQVEVADSLDARQLEAVLDLVAAATASDGTAPLNEAALLNLRHGHAGVRHVLARVGTTVVGYAQVQGEQADRTGELVVQPDHRRQGAGTALLDAMTSGGPLRLWAMSNTPAAQALARTAGLIPVRQLLIMKRSLAEPVPAVPPPDGVTIRTFVVGTDEQAWLAVNARAFAWHPEQGRMSRADLDERLAEPWFDPAGFFVAVRDGAMIGFHWTKQHPGRLGEVYMLGIDPAATGSGLGRALLAAGLEHLRERGNTEVELYTESDNRQALSLYLGYGFAVASRDVMYASSEIDPGSGADERLAES